MSEEVPKKDAASSGETNKFIRTRNGDTVGDNAKRRRILEKNPDTWVCLWIFQLQRLSY